MGLLTDGGIPKPQYEIPAGNGYEPLKGTNGGLYMTGDEAHDAVDAGNPVKIGGYAKATAPTAVADTDRVNAWFDPNGRLHVILDLGAAGDVAHDAADNGNPLKIGGKAASSTPTAVTAGDRVNAYFDLSGRQVVLIDSALPAGTNNIGDVDVLSLPAGVIAGMATLPAGTNNIGDVDIASKPAYGFVNITADAQVKAAAGKLRKVIIGKVAVAGDLVLYDSTTESGTVIITLGLETTGNPKELEFDLSFANGLYAGFDASLAGNITIVFE